MIHIPKWDGHTHTAFCPHGTSAELGRYLDRAVELGFTRYTVSEHSPLPTNWMENAELQSEMAMDATELPAYFTYVAEHKRKYEGRLEVWTGLEIDYLPGKPEYTLELVEQCHREVEDWVISLHFLPGNKGMRCLDYTPQDFEEGLLGYYGSMEKVVDEYYNQIEQAISLAVKLPGSRRLGHVNLIEKFSKSLPPIDPDQQEKRLMALLPKLAEAKVGIDVNTAGLRVPTCGKPYVPVWFINRCLEMGIPIVFGSDAHRPEHVGEGWSYYEDAINGSPAN
ncbi:histidinol-phosphatase HisJ [Paenibacillus sp. J2TS4]|uniref:histidinol-phosphatase HisJ n=1 Tax=Paenibacillus sp. J2TS4 TaxID=2807194 RepID=UPI001B16AFCE|nr:histidinol-phosphatase HisJ [Paenibacillus sp. J2TS4]GIP33778.1 histidinol-phosphatase [Paenibacillus sp. J2TS4]